MAINLQPYKYVIHKPDNYSFITDSGVEYVCYFSSYGEYFKDVEACRTTVEVKSLPTTIAIELKVIATLD